MHMEAPHGAPMLPPGHNLDVDRGMYLSQSAGSRGMGGFPGGDDYPYNMNGLPPHLLGAMGQAGPSPLGPPGQLGRDSGRYARGRGAPGDNGLDASRMGPPMQDVSGPSPWGQPGGGDQNSNYAMFPGAQKGYGDRMPGIFDGRFDGPGPLVGASGDYPPY